jgi:hypothetical protein
MALIQVIDSDGDNLALFQLPSIGEFSKVDEAEAKIKAVFAEIDDTDPDHDPIEQAETILGEFGFTREFVDNVDVDISY